MQRILIESKAIASVGYDAETFRLQIEFRDGAIYQYSGIGPEIWSALLNSESKGQYLNREIRGRFAHQLISNAVT